MKSKYATIEGGKVVVHGDPQQFSTQFDVGDLVTTRMHRPFSVSREIYGFIYAIEEFDGIMLYSIVAYNGKKYYSNNVKTAQKINKDDALADYLKRI